MSKHKNSMMDGYEALDDYWARTRIMPWQAVRVHFTAVIISILKLVVKPVRALRGRNFNLLAHVEAPKQKIDVLGNKRQEEHGGYYMSEEEVANFANNGIHGPFRVLEKEDAESLLTEATYLFENEFHKTSVLGDEILKTLKETGDYSNNYLSLFQGSRYRRLWDILVSRQVAHPMESLLGDDVLCWRSQFFEKQPGQEGSFWHQTGTFRESDKKPKLDSSVPRHPAIVQLNLWIALCDTDKEKACLRMLEGSFKDSRFERITLNIQDDIFGFLLSLPYSEIVKTLKTDWYTMGNFKKAQLVYEHIQRKVPSVFEDIRIRDLEMKAGEAVIFTSLNTHASYSNSTSDKVRMALSGRYTRPDVHIFKHESITVLPTKGGGMPYDVSKEPAIPVSGSATHPNTDNNIAEYPPR